MSQLYVNSTQKHLEIVPLLQTCKENIKRYIDRPQEMLFCNTDAFGQILPEGDNRLVSLREIPDINKEILVLQTITEIATGFVTILERQLQEYLYGRFSAPSYVLMDQASSAPVHNIWAERSLGMTDSQYHRAPNATTGFVDGKVRAKTNKTLEWLEKKDKEE